MIGFYDYTVVLTYMSLIAGSMGIFVTLTGEGHPYIGTIFLMVCGLCDTFDGMVARTKKNRTEAEKKFGVQIDSLSDLVAFGVLPAAIGLSMVWRCESLSYVPILRDGNIKTFIIPVILYLIMFMYVGNALIRLAYFNIKEEEGQNVDENNRRYFTGMPVTMAALLFPTVMLFQFLTIPDITLVYFAAMLVLGVLFVLNVKIYKPDNKGRLLLILFGIIELIILLLIKRRL